MLLLGAVGTYVVGETMVSIVCRHAARDALRMEALFASVTSDRLCSMISVIALRAEIPSKVFIACRRVCCRCG